MVTLSSTIAIDGERLICLKRSNAARFERLVNQYRQQGAGDGEIVKAMAGARGMISTLRLRGGR
jgi:hypothetical protein